MKNLGRKTFMTIAGICLAAAVFFATRAIITFPTGDLLSVFFAEWVFLSTYANLVNYFIPLCSAALLIAVSFLFTPKNGRGGLPFSKYINTTVILLLAVLCIYVIAKEITLPGVLVRKEEMKYLTDIAERAKDEAGELYSKGMYAEADKAVRVYLQIDEDDEEINTLKENILIKLDSAAVNPQNEADPNSMETAETKHITQFIEKAEYYFKMRDYYSAHYYANQALLIDPQRVDIKNLAAVSWQKINELTVKAKTEKEAQYYERKRSGYEAFQAKRYIDSYYIFRKLQKDRPGFDPDISKYLTLAENHLKETSYFLDEKESVDSMPGINNILFLNSPADTDRQSKQFVFIKRYVITREGYYCLGVEIIQMDKSGETESHIYSPFGKILQTENGQMLILQGLSRDNETDRTEPVIYTSKIKQELPPHIIPLYINTEGISVCSLNEKYLDQSKIPTLWNYRKTVNKLGYPEYLINMELIKRLLVPFTFLIISFLSLSLGWVLNIPGDLRKPHMFLILPFIPFLTALSTESYEFFSRVFYLYFLMQVGFTLTVVLVFVASTGMLILSLLLLALQVSKS